MKRIYRIVVTFKAEFNRKIRSRAAAKMLISRLKPPRSWSIEGHAIKSVAKPDRKKQPRTPTDVELKCKRWLMEANEAARVMGPLTTLGPGPVQQWTTRLRRTCNRPHPYHVHTRGSQRTGPAGTICASRKIILLGTATPELVVATLLASYYAGDSQPPRMDYQKRLQILLSRYGERTGLGLMNANDMDEESANTTYRIVPLLGPNQFGPPVAEYPALALAENDISRETTGRATLYPNATWAILTSKGKVVWVLGPTEMARRQVVRKNVPDYKTRFRDLLQTGLTRNEALNRLYEEMTH